VKDVEKVSSSLITSRRVIFTPSVDIKTELSQTGISITCYNRNGEVVKQVASADDGNVEDNEDDTTEPGNGGNDSGNGGNTTPPTDDTGDGIE
jgi:hypothetical protein